MCVLNTSRLGLVPCKMRLDPCDRSNLVELGENPTPQIPVLETNGGSPLEGSLEGLADIPAVSDNMNTGLEPLDRLKEGGDLASLRCLSGTQHRSIGSDALVGSEAPTCSGSTRCGAASPISGDYRDIITE